MTTLRIVVLGGPGVGKSAVTVRYLTRRFIGEYTSGHDMLYSWRVNLDTESEVNIEILDCSCQNSKSLLEERIKWGDAFVVVYSVCDRVSYLQAPDMIRRIRELKSAGSACVLLLGNKADLEQSRLVNREEGSQLALEEGCQFQEVSAAEGYSHVSLAFNALLREGCSMISQRSLRRNQRRRNSSLTKGVAKALASMFGKGSKTVAVSAQAKVTVSEMS